MPDRFAKVVDGLYRGGEPTQREVQLLNKAYGIKKIVSLDQDIGEDIDPICKELGINHIIWGLGKGNDPKIAALKKRILPTLLHDGPTYVHCKHGKDRTGMTVAMFRIYNGWPLKKAIKEASEFGMGLGLPRDVAETYYKAVYDFSKEYKEDTNNIMDIVTQTRDENSFGPVGTGMNDYSQSYQLHLDGPPHADIEFSQLSRIASNRIFCRCKSSKILMPNVYWWASPEQANLHPTDEGGRLFSASIISGSVLERFDKHVNERLIHEVLTKDIDAAALRGGLYLVIDPNILVNIKEEDDVNHMVDVGMRDTSTDYTFAYPGSGSGIGGMPDGAAGVVQLPYSGQGQV